MKNKKFNIIDFVIVLLVIAIICAGVFAYIYIFNSSDKDGVECKLQYTIEVNGLTEEATKRFESLDEITIGSTRSYGGKVKKAEITNYRTIATDSQNGEYIWTEVPNEYTALITVECDAIKTENAYMIEDEVISVGVLMPLNGKGAAASNCYIIDMAEVK